MKRLAALLMTAALLLSMIPSALAIAIDPTYNGTDPYYIGTDPYYNGTVNHVHDYQRTVYQAPTCTEGGYASFSCSCGNAYREQYGPLGHDFGEWKTTKAANCKEEGTQERVCSRCGLTEYNYLPTNDNHDWGDWKVEIPGNCVTIELRYHRCRRCNKTEYRNWGYGDHDWLNGTSEILSEPNCTYPGLAVLHCAIDKSHTQQSEIPIDPEAHDWGEWEVVIPATESTIGLERRVCKINPDHYEERDLVYNGPTVAPFIPEPQLKVTGSYSGGPFKEGDTFTVDLTVYNLGNVALNLNSYDASDRDQSGDPLKNLPAVLDPFESWPVTVTVTVTAADIADAVIDPITGLLCMSRSWVVRYDYIDAVATAAQSLSDAYDISPEIEDPSKTVGNALNAGLRMTVSEPDPDKPYYLKDDAVTFEITLHNVGDVELENCQATVVDGDGTTTSVDFGTLAAGEMKTLPWSVTINDTHVDNGRDLINFDGFGWVPEAILNGDVPVSGHQEGLVMAMPDERDLTVKAAPPEDYALYLEVTNLTPQASYALGDEFIFEATVTNNSSDTLYDVYVHMGFDSVGNESRSIGTLAPGESASVTFYETVINEDLPYAAANGGQLGLHWIAYGYTDADDEVPSNECTEYINIDQEEPKPAITITNITEGSGAGKQVGDYVYVHLTVQNTGNTTWIFSGVFIDGTGPAHYDFSDVHNYTSKEYAPGEKFDFDVGIEVRDTDADVKAVIRDFMAHANGMIDSNTVSCNIPLDDIPIPPPVKAPGYPQLSLSVVSLDAEPFFFDGAGKTGDKHYQAVVSNIGAAECFVTEILVGTGTGSYSEPIGPFHLYPAESTSNIVLIHDFSETELSTDGKLRISFTAYGYKDDEDYNSNTVEITHEVTDMPPWIPPVETKVIVEKYEVSTPSNPKGYMLGEVVDYQIWVYNDSEVVIPEIEVDDSLIGGYVYTFTDLAPYTWDYAATSYTVTQADVDAGKIENTATATWTDPESGEKPTATSNTVVVFTTEPEEPDVWIDITFEKEPANGSFYVEGETFPIRVDWGNSGKETLYHVYVNDSMADWMGYGTYLVEDATMAPGETGTFTYPYVVDDIDVDMLNQVYDWAAICGYDQYDIYHYATDEESRPAGREVPDPEAKTPGLKVEKKETSHSSNPSYYVEGETITYEITVTNTGNVDLVNVTVADSLSDTFKGVFATITVLHPGEARKYLFSHVVTKADVDATKVINYAIGYYSYDLLTDVPVFSDPVISPTGPQKGPTPPHTPDGHIDTPIVKTGKDDVCILTLVSKGDGTAEYEQHLCTKHAAVTQNASDWQEAANAWKAALDEMYQDILRASTGSARMAVMSERAVFFAYVDSFKAVMKQQYPRQPEMADMLAAELLMRQCAELCYVIHYAPEERPDSLFTGSYKITYTSGLNGARCYYDETPHGSDLTSREILCKDHAKIDADAFALVRQAVNRQSAAQAFKSARRNWLAELNNMVSTQYKEAAKEDRKMISSCRTLFDSLLEKREELYSFIYAGYPEVVQEVLTRTVERDVILRCK